MAKIITADEAISMIKDGMTLMIGGFLGCGNPHTIVDRLSKSGVKELTVICNDGAMPNGPDGGELYGIAKLIHNRQIKKLVASHVGLNPEVGLQTNDGVLELLLVPQGSLAEMIRAGGAGLGGVLTPTGIGTEVEKYEHVHSIIEVDGRRYMLERPLHADIALISGCLVDRKGNIWYRGTTRNFSQVMATAADTVIVEADEIVEAGKILPENVMTPGVFVDFIVESGDVSWKKN
jgi:acetate CoA/acetoacetate CoA-transferase alpha subunit